MRALYVAFVGIWVASLLAGRHAAGPAFPSPNAATSAETTIRPLTPAGEVVGVPSLEAAHPAVDLVGNEIEHAIADYRIDRGGIVYERHAPETTVERLGSPST